MDQVWVAQVVKTCKDHVTDCVSAVTLSEHFAGHVINKAFSHSYSYLQPCERRCLQHLTSCLMHNAAQSHSALTRTVYMHLRHHLLWALLRRWVRQLVSPPSVKMIEPALNQTASWNCTPFCASSSGVMQPRAPNIAHLAWMTSMLRYLSHSSALRFHH